MTNSAHYRILRGVNLASAKITVDISNIKKSLILENDLGKLNAEKPFMPFGPVPVVGSTLYVGCEEALNKTLESVTVKFTSWVGKPAFSSHYAAYNNTYKKEDNFTAAVNIINGNLKTQPATHKKLFSSAVGDFQNGVSVPDNYPASIDYFWNWSFGYSYAKGGYLRSANNFILLRNDFVSGFANRNAVATVSDSLLKIRLNKDFGHGVYPNLLTDAVTRRGLAAKLNDTTNIPIPNPPYTPLASEFLLSYKASTQVVELANKDFDKFSKRDLQLFHLGVFGQAEEHAFLKQDLNFLSNNDKNTVHILPTYGDNGSFYMGLQDITALEAASILFQVSDGSANPERETPVVKWQILCQNHWRDLNGEDILSDTTQHFLSSGIIKFYLPAETTTTNTLFDSGYVWLKAELFKEATPSVSAENDSVCNLIALHTQAVLTKFSDNNNDPAHYATPLLAQTIKKSRTSLGAIKKIEQPYASFGNKSKETDTAFYQRISERLRHKQRVVTIWDYEHLVLEAYPSVFKAKCLNHTLLNKSFLVSNPRRLQQLSPGNVTVVLVPDIRNLNAVNPLEPKVDLATLDNIQVFLKRHAGMLVNIVTTNPDYEPVRLQFNVRFNRGYEFAVYKKKLNEDIMRYLSPWAFDSAADIPFGGTLEKSVVINFIERLGYVDVVHDFKLLSKKDNFSYDYEEIAASSPMAVLVSCSQHNISPFGNC
jgi:hypothetical protein